CLFVQAEDGIRDRNVTGVQTCALPISKTKTLIKHPGISNQIFFSSINRLSRRRIILHYTQRRNSHPLIASEHRSPHTQMLSMRLRRRTIKPLHIRNIASVLILSHTENTAHDSLEP